MELVVVLLWFVLPIVACVVAFLMENTRVTAFVQLYLFFNYAILAVVCAVLVVV